MKRIKLEQQSEATLGRYILGFGLSLVATLTAYGLVVMHTMPLLPLVLLITGLALSQFMVQLVLFLHLGAERGTQWKLFVFGFMVLIVLIVVLGSLWIMHNLDGRMPHSPQEVNTYLHKQDGI